MVCARYVQCVCGVYNVYSAYMVCTMRVWCVVCGVYNACVCVQTADCVGKTAKDQQPQWRVLGDMASKCHHISTRGMDND